MNDSTTHHSYHTPDSATRVAGAATPVAGAATPVASAETPGGTRRAFLISAAVLAGATGAGVAYFREATSPPNWNHDNVAQLGGEVTLAEFGDDGAPRGLASVRKIVQSDEEWKAQLTARQYAVTRQKGTEPPFTGRYNKFYEHGIYRCVACGTALFSSRTKFDSGTGWPSFWAPIADENVAGERDWSLGIPRTEVLCRRCDAHLGHVFHDGPPPTHLRYCLNSEALLFVPKSR